MCAEVKTDHNEKELQKYKDDIRMYGRGFYRNEDGIITHIPLSQIFMGDEKDV